MMSKRIIPQNTHLVIHVDRVNKFTRVTEYIKLQQKFCST